VSVDRVEPQPRVEFREVNSNNLRIGSRMYLHDSAGEYDARRLLRVVREAMEKEGLR
jgi:hypothetical protein